ncbi:PTS sugar transporter subunit IIA [Viridibacillus arvi]|uniref:PTS sugar transporter subunit IIA n=1 Tax=Viridibacillus arvi TaxID=263475 RepID=UPI0038083D6B
MIKKISSEMKALQLGGDIYQQSQLKRNDIMLKNMLTKETVVVEDTCDTWQNAVLKAGELLKNTGAIEESYITAMAESVEKNGPYMVIAPGIALLHARPEDGVNEACMSLQVLKNGVSFGHKERDPVTLAFAFGAVDAQLHLQALQQLMELFNDEDRLTKLKNCENVEEALVLLNEL